MKFSLTRQLVLDRPESLLKFRIQETFVDSRRKFDGRVLEFL